MSREKGLQQRKVYSLEPAFPRLVWPSGSKNAALQPWGILLTPVVLAGASTVHLRSKLHDGRDVGKEGRGHASSKPLPGVSVSSVGQTSGVGNSE